jgi:ectoine hydroxylase-related dioxygenase (phytanoyl-CoA dioxygenase family)
MNESAAVPSIDIPYVLTREEIRQYQRGGHMILREVASAEEIALYRPVIEEVTREWARKRETQGRIEEYGRFFLQVTNVWRLHDALRRFVFARRFARIAAELMGVQGVRLYHDQALFKPPGGKATPWHQDQFYWPLDTRHTITMWMPLVDVPETMGTMRFASGSHIDGPLVNLAISDKAHDLFDEIISTRQFPIVSHALRAGDATFHAGWTVHSTYANSSNNVREVMTVIYYADGTRLREPESEFQKTDLKVFHPGQKPGDLAASEFNPLLYP